MQATMHALTALLKAPDTKKDKSVSLRHFTMAGATLFDAEQQTIVSHQAGLWRAPGTVYISVDFESPASIHFKNAEIQREV